MFKDCFGKPLREGDDVIVSVEDNVLCDGIVLNDGGNFIIIGYHYWVNEKEMERTLSYHMTDGDMGLIFINGKFVNVYKI